MQLIPYIASTETNRGEVTGWMIKIRVIIGLRERSTAVELTLHFTTKTFRLVPAGVKQGLLLAWTNRKAGTRHDKLDYK